MKENEAARIDPRTERRVASQAGGVAVIPVRGVIIPRPNIFEMFGLATSAQTIGQSVHVAMDDPEIKAVVMHVNSPGGVVSGVPELAGELRGLRGRKPIVAHADYLMASAAYWIASSADEIIASPSAMVGSVGVYGMHIDQSGWLEQMGLKVTLIADPDEKVEGNSFEPLSQSAQAHIQKLVSNDLNMFRADVAAGRSMKAADIADSWARIYQPREALAMGMIDKIRPLSETLQAYGISQASQSQSSRSRAKQSAVRQREIDQLTAELSARGVGVAA